MSPVIRIDDEVYEGLKKLATPFDDTPNTVIRKLLQDARILPKNDAHHDESPTSHSTSSETRGGRTPESAFRRPILEALVDMGGSGTPKEVIERVGKKMEKKLTPRDHSRTSSGWIRWQIYTRWERQNMKMGGLLTGPHGQWEITDKGRAWLTR